MSLKLYDYFFILSLLLPVLHYEQYGRYKKLFFAESTYFLSESNDRNNSHQCADGIQC